MTVPDELFDDDYLYFYAPALTDERCDAEAASIIRLLELTPGMRVLDVPCGEGRIAGRLARHGCDVVVSNRVGWSRSAANPPGRDPTPPPSGSGLIAAVASGLCGVSR